MPQEIAMNVPVYATGDGKTCRPNLPFALANFAEQLERDQQAVDDQRLDERQADDHRDEDLARGLRVARDALEGRAGGAALTDGAAQSREAYRERGGDAEPLVAVETGDVSGLREGRRAGEHGHD